MVLLLSLLAAACGTTDTGTADDASPDVADADDGADNGEEADDESDPEDDAAADNSADESADDSTDDSVDEPTEPAGAASSGDVPGVTEDSILLGTTLPITGVAAAAGEGLLAGITIALDEANAEGGIDGRMLELVALDDGFDPPRLVSNARRLIEEEGVYAMASPAGSQALPGIWDFVEDAGTIVWGPVSPQDPQIQEAYILGPGRGEQMQICTDYAAEQGITQVGLIGQDNQLGEEGNAGMEAATAANGLEYVGFERVEVLSQDISSAVLNMRDAGAEAIMLATDNVQAALIMQETQTLGYDVVLCADNGGGGTGGPNTVDSAGDAAEGFIGGLQVQLPTNTDNEAVAAWRELAEAYTGEGSAQSTSNFSLQTYYYTRALLEILDRLDGDLAYENFHAEAESLVDDPLDLGALPILACGPLPEGHSCASGAALAQYSVADETWTVIRDFMEANG
ncbi:ABC transporter substrate-binding protein [Euzebya tangerina]|uniref:ABC transporter substrate-binding protein n=1 Tax=Euzebya tangerina TaxID=591198 RepID=UPI0013C33153|nr:ABC transporter substrate-binding protein [Euzebya tangerina]